MTDAYVQLAADGSGKKVDVSELAVGANTVERQRIVLADDAVAGALASVKNTMPGATDYAISVRDTGDNLVAFNGQASATGVIWSGDVSGFQSFTAGQYQSSNPTILCEISVDGVTWQGFQVWQISAGTQFKSNPWSGTLANNEISYGKLPTRYMRLRCTSFSSLGTGNVVLVLHRKPFLPETIGINPNGTLGVSFSKFWNTSAISLSAVAANSAQGIQNNPAWSFTLTSLGVGGVVVTEGTLDNTNWVPIDVFPANGGQPVNSISAPGQFKFDGRGMQQVRLRVAALTSGTVAGGWSNHGAENPDQGYSYSHPSAPSKQVGSTNWIKSVASVNANVLKASPGNIQGFLFTNNAAYAVFVKLYDKSSAPTVGTDVPVTVLGVPAGGNLRFAPMHALPFFTTGIAYAITKAAADADVTAVAANDLTGFLLTA